MSTISISLDDRRFAPSRSASTRRASTRPASARSVNRPDEQAPVRLTRRGRVVLVLVALAALAAGAVAFGSSTVATGEAGTVQATEVVTVQAGQTIWQIAAEANPAGDVRDTVEDIMRMNSLPDAGALQMGADIAVPVYQ